MKIIMANQEFVIRKMTQDDIEFAIDLAADEGWNPGLHDADCFYTADEDGFYVGLLDGQPIGSVSAVRYGENYGFLGLYIVKPEFRGVGYGMQLFEQALHHLQGRDIGLDGVIEQEPNYTTWGFRRAFYSVRYQGKAATYPSTDSRVVDLSKVSFSDIETFDQTMFLAPRSDFLRCWISRPQSIALGTVEDSKLGGYTVLRKCQVGYKIGPLFAGNEELAEALFRAGCNRLPEGTTLFLDVPLLNPEAEALATRYKMTEVFKTARMYRMVSKQTVDLPLKHWFGVTSFELG